MKMILRVFALLSLAAMMIGTATAPLSAQVSIPEGSTILSATFAIYLTTQTDQTVTLHRCLAGWEELTVTWDDYGGQYDPGDSGVFTADGLDWRTVNVTGLVQNWVAGTYPNYGFILMQGGGTPATTYNSSEALTIALRPKLEIVYRDPEGVEHMVLIQRPDVAQDGVADAYTKGDLNYGSSEQLITGHFSGAEKYSFIKFIFTVTPPPPPDLGTGTPGYWMNHPEAWPVPAITIGGITYPLADAIRLMQMPVATDKTYSMFAALVAAKLNVLIGNDSSCIAVTIAAADAWMAEYNIGYPVLAGGKTSPWRVGEPLFTLLDAYNNGLLCAPPRY